MEQGRTDYADTIDDASTVPTHQCRSVELGMLLLFVHTPTTKQT